jgi:nucleoside-diphosphate-sugar epimerase
VITGANSGLGFEAAKVLAQHGATVVLACRNLDKAADAVVRIGAVAPRADLSTLPLDLASLASVHRAAERHHLPHRRTGTQADRTVLTGQDVSTCGLARTRGRRGGAPPGQVSRSILAAMM